MHEQLGKYEVYIPWENERIRGDYGIIIIIRLVFLTKQVCNLGWVLGQNYIIIVFIFRLEVAAKVEAKTNELSKTSYADLTKRKLIRLYKKSSFKARNCPNLSTVS